ncbi:MAG: hypothetical protein ACPG7W_02875 [Paracoccaceae bacterium]
MTRPPGCGFIGMDGRTQKDGMSGTIQISHAGGDYLETEAALIQRGLRQRGHRGGQTPGAASGE